MEPTKPAPTIEELIARLGAPRNRAEDYIISSLHSEYAQKQEFAELIRQRIDARAGRKVLSDYWHVVFATVTTVERFRDFGHLPI